MANVLGPGESLRPGMSLFSTNRLYELRMQGDGNLVLYRTSDWKPLWWSRTEGRIVAALTMQLDAIWCSIAQARRSGPRTRTAQPSRISCCKTTATWRSIDRVRWRGIRVRSSRPQPSEKPTAP
jgi:hypothetical protein